MFQTIFKHFIYDYCIELAFDNLIKNFPETQFKFVVGQKFDAFECEVDDIWWGVELAEILFCDSDVIVISYASGEAHIPVDHPDIIKFENDNTWEERGAYGSELGDTNIMYANYFGGTHVFPVKEMKDIDYV